MVCQGNDRASCQASMLLTYLFSASKGESYAGYFAPSIAYKIFQEQGTLDDTSDIPLNLAGVGLGNGWANAMVQGPATIDYGYWHGLYDEHTRQALHAEWNHCINSPKDEEEPAPFHKVNAPDDCGMMLAPLMAGGRGVWDENMNGPNAYDVTTWDGYPVILGGNTSTIDNFFNDPRVKEKLHAPKDVQWQGWIIRIKGTLVVLFTPDNGPIIMGMMCKHIAKIRITTVMMKIIMSLKNFMMGQ